MRKPAAVREGAAGLRPSFYRQTLCRARELVGEHRLVEAIPVALEASVRVVALLEPQELDELGVAALDLLPGRPAVIREEVAAAAADGVVDEPPERRGAWTQSVLQVDDSPRYAARGRWQHAGGVSSWISDETWRPLPRREFSVRKDYDVLVGTNRHTITPQGWVQEENNLKLAMNERRYLAREYGVARYDRIRDYDFGAGEKYYARTEPFWAEVRAAWRELGEAQARFSTRAPVDQAQLFVPFFDYAQKLVDGDGAFDRDAARAFIRRTLQDRYLK